MAVRTQSGWSNPFMKEGVAAHAQVLHTLANLEPFDLSMQSHSESLCYVLVTLTTRVHAAKEDLGKR